MSDKGVLGDRMKRYENVTRHLLPRRTYSIIRVDGKSFHTYLKGAEKPFDQAFMDDMDAVAVQLCKEIDGARFAYVQSDEISVLVTDFDTTTTQPWFGGVVAKQVSVSAALATAALNERRPGKRALFDSRVFTIADPVEVANYFLWRQRDAVTNSVSMTAQTYFSHRDLHGKNTLDMQEMLSGADRNWHMLPQGFRNGRVVRRMSARQTVEYTDKRTGKTVRTQAERSSWQPTDAPQFTAEEGMWLSRYIPPMSSL